MEEKNENIVELIDENNEKKEFEYIEVVKYNGCEYVVLAPCDEMEDDIDESDESDVEDLDEVDVIIMKIVKDENGEDVLETVEDEEELDNVFAEFSESWVAEDEDEDEE